MNYLEQNAPLNEFEVETDDTRLPDGSAYRWQPWPPREHVARWIRTHWRWSSALLALLVTLFSLTGTIPEPRPGTSPLPVVIEAQRDGIACLQELAWAPDGQQIALLGYRQRCPVQDYSYKPGLLNFYNVDSGQLLRQVEPDTAILQAMQNLLSNAQEQRASQTQPLIFYTAILWSRQTEQLALTFALWTSAPPASATFSGVLLMNARGEQQRVLLQPTSGTAAYEEWDVQRGSLISGNAAYNTPSVFFSNLPTAPVYRWGSDGALLAEGQPTHAVPPTVPPGPVGNPVGDSVFSFWQPGQAALIVAPGGPVETPGVFFWSSSFAAWSPDGRYLVDSFSITGRMQPPGTALPSQKTLIALKANQVPLLDAHDAALLQMLHLLAQAPGELAQTLAIAWRADGLILAAYGSAVDNGQTVNLYDSATGQQLAALTPFPSDGPSSAMFWSPDGRRLLRQSGPFVTIWQPELPGWL